MTDVTPCKLIKVCAVSGGHQRRAKRRKPIRCCHPSALLCGGPLGAVRRAGFAQIVEGVSLRDAVFLGRASVQVTAACVDGYVDRSARCRRADLHDSPDRGFNG